MKIDYSLPTFNPGDVDIRLQYISIMQMEKMIETGKMYLPEKDELQRMSNAWSDNLFDAFSYAVADLNDYEYLNLINKGQVFNEKYRMLFRDGRFLCKSKLRRNSRKAAESR